jgi:hypothetical protein
VPFEKNWTLFDGQAQPVKTRTKEISLLKKCLLRLAMKPKNGLTFSEAPKGDEVEFFPVCNGRLRRSFAEVHRDRRTSTKELTLEMIRKSLVF